MLPGPVVQLEIGSGPFGMSVVITPRRMSDLEFGTVPGLDAGHVIADK